VPAFSPRVWGWSVYRVEKYQWPDSELDSGFPG
jgi:hypothetical protein